MTAAATSEGPPLLEVDSLEVHGLAPVSFSLAAGECLAVLGPSGSGKTVLLRALADLDPAPGRVHLNGLERGDLSGPEWRRKVRYSAAEPGWWAETPREHFAAEDAAAELVTMLGLAPAQLDDSLSRLSTGERQRLASARAIIDQTTVLLLDEPTGALDQRASELAEQLIRRCLDGGAGILLTSHDPDQVARLADRRLEIRDGRLGERPS